MPVIRSEAEYRGALERLAKALRAGTVALQPDMGALADQIGAYEVEHYDIGLPDPIEAIDFRIKQLGWTEAKLADRLGIEPRRLRDVLASGGMLPALMVTRLQEELGLSEALLRQPRRRGLGWG